VTSPSRARDGADRCPGLLAPFVSADGAMIRLRLPGGRVEAATLTAIADLARRHGDPSLTLTSRGSLQLRGLPDPLPRELVAAIGDLGLVPSGEHDRARNIVADPDPALDDPVASLDSGLLARPELAALPGRFLLTVARPGGPALAEPWDVAVVDEGRTARVVVDGRSVVVPRKEAAATALGAARRFLDARADERTWNVRDLPADARAELLPDAEPYVVDAAGPPSPGPLGDDLVVLVPLGVLTSTMARTLAEVLAPRPPRRGALRITPWRSIVVPGGAERADDLAAAGLVTSPGSPWTVLTACAGAPLCGRTDTPTRSLARQAAHLLDPAGPPVHVTGCERACGHPARDHTTAPNPTTAMDIVAAQRSSTRKAP